MVYEFFNIIKNSRQLKVWLTCQYNANIKAKCQYLSFCCRYFGMGRYAGYSQGHSEYSVKSLTESNKCEEQNNRVHIYTPVTLQRIKQDSSNRDKKGSDNTMSSKVFIF